MNLLFDANIILAFARAKSGSRIIEYLNPGENAIYVSFVNLAEAQSIAYQNHWGDTKLDILDDFLIRLGS